MKKIIMTTNAPAAIGPYSQAVEVNGTLYISGQLPVDPATGKIEAKTVAEQARQSLKNVGAILAAAGYTYDDVVKSTVYLADMSYFAEMNEVYASFFKENPPARSTIQVVALPKGSAVEIWNEH